MLTVVLLTISNVFMTFAWYGHLKFKHSPLWAAVMASWLIAFVEYCFQVSANRLGHLRFSGAQLKVMQEVITILVFCVFCVAYLKESLRWNHIVGFLLILGSVVVVFGFEPSRDIPEPDSPAIHMPSLPPAPMPRDRDVA
jgi:uncharacterized protein (DUF486 family)